MSENSLKSLVKNTSTVSAGTLTSRILGFFRDVVLARFLGTGLAADALFVAFRIPNLFRDLVGEGAVNSAVVPVFSERLVKDERQGFWSFVSIILLLAIGILAVLTLLGVILAPWIVRVIAPGFMHEPQKLALTVQLTRILFPYLLFIGLTAYTMAVLYTFRAFKVPAFSPCLLNIAIIIAACLAGWWTDAPVYGIAVGILIGGFLQLAVQIRPMIRQGFRFQKPAFLTHPGVSQIGRLLIPRMIGAGVYQLTVFIDTFCASLAAIVGIGGISAVYYSNRIIQLPMGVFVLALASAILPTMSSLAAQKDMDGFKKTVVFALESIFFIMIPAAVIVMVLARPIISVLFQRGAFDSYSTDITSAALAFYAIGLFAFGGIKILVAAFHSLQDTKTPVKVSAACLVINVVLNIILMFPMKIAGIAFASAIAGMINFSALFFLIQRRIGDVSDGLKVFVMKVVLASVFSGFIVKGLWLTVGLPQAWKLCLCLAAGLGVYFFVSIRLKVDQARKIIQWMWKRA